MVDSWNSSLPQHTRESKGSVIAQLWNWPQEMYDEGRVNEVEVGIDRLLDGD